MPASEVPFISLAERLRAPAPVPIADVACAPLAIEPESCDEVASALIAHVPEYAGAVSAARRFSAHLAATFDALLADLMRDLAASVLARELQLAPADVAAIAARLVRERSADGPVRVRVAPADRDAAIGIATVVDPTLESGDVILECTHGGIDARLGVRLADALERVRA